MDTIPPLDPFADEHVHKVEVHLASLAFRKAWDRSHYRLVSAEARVDKLIDETADRMSVEFEAYIAAGAPESVTVTASVSHPATWWDHVKHDLAPYLERDRTRRVALACLFGPALGVVALSLAGLGTLALVAALVGVPLVLLAHGLLFSDADGSAAEQLLGDPDQLPAPALLRWAKDHERTVTTQKNTRTVYRNVCPHGPIKATEDRRPHIEFLAHPDH